MARIEFGRPTDFYQAVMRLPNTDHPDYGVDQQIERLAHLKDRLESPLVGPLEERMVPLDIEDVALMERWSFVLGKPEEVFPWTRVGSSSSWAPLFYRDENEYGYFTIWFPEPRLETQNGWEKLLCVAENRSFDVPTDRVLLLSDPETELNLGIVNRDEYDDLLKALEEGNYK